MKIGTAKKSERKLRIALFGKDSVGKTHFGLSGPQKVVVFDAEGRIDAMTDVFGDIPIIEYDQRNMARELVEAAVMLRNGEATDENGKPFGTFVIDSWTTIEKDFEKKSNIDTTGDGRNRVRALGDFRKRIENELLNPMFIGPTKCHMVAIAHEALQWEGDGKSVSGAKPDATRNFKHYFDLVFHMTRETVGTQVKRYATVVKSNYQHVLPIGMRIENLSWNHPVIQKIINAEVTVQAVPMAELVELHKRAGLPDGSLGKWVQANGFTVINNKLSAEDTHSVKGMLETLIEEAEELGATA